MKRTFPLVICFGGGIIFIIQFFIPHPVSKAIYDEALNWLIIVSVFAFAIALESLFRVHGTKIKRRKPGWGFSVIPLVACITVGAFGIIQGVREGTVFMKVFHYITVPMSATVFSLLAFYMASAAFRAFRATTTRATVLLIVAFLVMFGRVPIGPFVWKGLPDIIEWIFMYPSMAATRGIALGVGLGIIGTSLKIILGIEKGWLGGGGK
ncbi:hypothetical protein KAW65_01880 [candidate division WOR-3 bacterium]|nr:hypothetical protein [candidate division WOR-3 bacterium]